MPRVQLDLVETSYVRFIDWVKCELVRRGMRQEELAEYLGISRVSLNLKLNGKTGITFREFLNILEYFGEKLPMM